MIDRIRQLLGIGRISRVDDAGDLQLLQVTEGAIGEGFTDQVSDNIRRVSEFGFASVPPIGSEVVMLRRAGQRSQSLAVATSHRKSRPRGLKEGDAGIYDVRGAKVMLTDKGLVIDCAGLPAVVSNTTSLTIKASEKVRIEASMLEVTGDVVSRADGTKVSLNKLRDAYQIHKHGGVQTGTNISATTDTPL